MFTFMFCMRLIDTVQFVDIKCFDNVNGPSEYYVLHLSLGTQSILFVGVFVSSDMRSLHVALSLFQWTDCV